MSRPPSWPKKVIADELIVNLYKAIAAVQAKPELFNDCHIFEGASIQHIPYIDVLGDTIPLPKHLSRFLYLPIGKKTCSEHNCCNPFHFQADSNLPRLKGIKAPPEPLNQVPTIDHYLEAVQSTMADHDIKIATFSLLRPLIHTEDISDEFLKLSIEKLNHA